MKRTALKADLPDFEAIIDKLHASSEDTNTDAIADFQLPWPDLWNEILCPGQRQTGEPANTLETETLEADNVAGVPLEPFQAAIDVGQNIDDWAQTIIPPSSIDGVHDAESSSDVVCQDRTDSSLTCFGMIHDSTARLIGDMQYLQSRLTALKQEDNVFSVRLALIDQFVFLMTEDGTQVGQLNDGMTKALAQLSGITSLVFEAFASVRDTLRCIHRARRMHESVIKIDINIYGNVQDRDQVGSILSACKVYLQLPLHRKDDFEHNNPHMIVFDDVDLVQDVVLLGDQPVSPLRPVGAEKVIADICRSETCDKGLRGLRKDVHVKTPLLHHQEQALEFMVQREDGPIPEEFSVWESVDDEKDPGFRHIIAGSWTATAPIEWGYGILADDMGMGKTLSMLSLITRKLPEGLEWSKTAEGATSSNCNNEVRSQATIVVVSSILIMNGWFKEIEDHLDGSLKVVKYHGRSRHSQFSKLTDSDIVITTYHTLAAERKTKRSPLKSIKWFRIVLDEAHTIRRQATTLCAAVSELHARYRWCLTGTPVQNTLVDVGSLLGFLQAYPFDKASMFRKHIIAPFTDDLEVATKNLKTLLNSICLRRSIARLHLPPMDEYIHYVDLTKDERHHYDHTLDTMLRTMTYGSREHFAGTPFGKFQIQLQLRILCNHGTFQRPFRNGQQDLQVQREDVVSSLGTEGEVRCSCCEQRTLTVRTNLAADKQALLPDRILCDECVLQFLAEHDESGAQSKCNSSEGRSSGASSTTTLLRPQQIDTSPSRGFDSSGYSAKMAALVADLEDGLLATKSIIFSCWTRSLNLVAWHLDQRHIQYVRIDGNTDISSRQSILDAFAENNDMRVLLMTTGTGAYGLNLAVANRVFILEPQWNPSIENQAIARVQRFLQTQSVKVIRYVVRSTVEEDIRRQQIGKAVLAERGF